MKRGLKKAILILTFIAIFVLVLGFSIKENINNIAIKTNIVKAFTQQLENNHYTTSWGEYNVFNKKWSGKTNLVSNLDPLKMNATAQASYGWGYPIVFNQIGDYRYQDYWYIPGAPETYCVEPGGSIDWNQGAHTYYSQGIYDLPIAAAYIIADNNITNSWKYKQVAIWKLTANGRLWIK